jgi:hypothetical protein
VAELALVPTRFGFEDLKPKSQSNLRSERSAE